MIWYTVYLTDTDEIVASGTAQECIKALGMTRQLLLHRQSVYAGPED